MTPSRPTAPQFARTRKYSDSDCPSKLAKTKCVCVGRNLEGREMCVFVWWRGAFRIVQLFFFTWIALFAIISEHARKSGGAKRRKYVVLGSLSVARLGRSTPPTRLGSPSYASKAGPRGIC